jgi:1,4-dihydroxy-2-naphthoate octaprenyltransferase
MTESHPEGVNEILDERFLKGLLQLGDPKIWTASLVPFTLGTCLAAAHHYEINIFLLLLSLVVLILIEIGKNGLNEYYDYKSGADLFVAPADRSPFSGGKKVIVDRLLTLQEVGWISVVCILLAFLIAVPLIRVRPAILFFGAIGTFFAVAYSVPPFQLGYRGLGELAVGFTFGPVVVNGAYYLQAGILHREPLLLSIPLGLLITNVLWINEVPDVEADRRAEKWNLVARRGRKQALRGYVALFAMAFFAIVVISLILRHPAYLIAFAAAIPVLPAVRCASQNLLNTQKLMRANALTIQIYLLTGVLLSIAAFL